MLDRVIDISSSCRAKKLKDACRTRWVARIESFTTFVELHEAVHTCLDAMAHPSLHTDLGTNWSWDGDTVTKANGFLFQLQSSFLVSLHILLQVMTLLKELTLKLQMQAIDVVYAYSAVTSVISTFQELRRHSEVEFKKIYHSATRMGVTLHGEGYILTTPRLAGRQLHRDNHPSSSVEEYYRITLFDEFLSHIISELNSRFSDNPAHKVAQGLFKLLPSNCMRPVVDDISLSR